MDEQPVKQLTVGDLTTEHYGWIINVKDDTTGFIGTRDIYLFRHCVWEYQEQQLVGLVSKEFERKYILGTEYSYASDTPCRVVRQWQKPRKARKQKG